MYIALLRKFKVMNFLSECFLREALRSLPGHATGGSVGVSARLKSDNIKVNVCTWSVNFSICLIISKGRLEVKTWFWHLS